MLEGLRTHCHRFVRATIDVDTKSLELCVDDAELEQRREQWSAPPFKYVRGVLAKYCAHVTDASKGCVVHK